MFGSTYTRVRVKQVKCKNINRMADETLNDSLRLATTKLPSGNPIDKGTIVSEKPRPQASH